MTTEEAAKYSELRSRGFIYLNKEEKAEFQRLKALSKYIDDPLKGPGEQKVTPIEAVKHESPVRNTEPAFSITKSELDEYVKHAMEQAGFGKLQQQTEGLEEALQVGKWIKARTPQKQNRIAKLKIYREDGISEPGIIIDWRFKKNAFDEISRRYDIPIYDITVLYNSGEKHYEIPLVEMSKISEFETVEILKEEVTEQEMSDGQGRKSVNDKGYLFSNPAFFGTKGAGTGEVFDYIVKRKETKLTIKRPNGQEMEIKNERVN